MLPTLHLSAQPQIWHCHHCRAHTEPTCARAGYLSQDPELDGSLTVLDAVLQSDSDAAVAVQDYHRALASVGSSQQQGPGSAAQRAAIDSATSAVDALGAWSLDTDARSLACTLHLFSSLHSLTIAQYATLFKQRANLTACKSTVHTLKGLMCTDEFVPQSWERWCPPLELQSLCVTPQTSARTASARAALQTQGAHHRC